MNDHNKIKATDSEKELYGDNKKTGSTIPPDIEKNNPEKSSPKYEEDDDSPEQDPNTQPPERKLDPPKRIVKTPVANPNPTHEKTPDATPGTDGGDGSSTQQPGNV